MRTFVAAKIHSIHVTDKSIDYHGSVSIASDLLEAAGIHPYEQVHVINLNNGARWVTYALPVEPGAFTLNGGGARLGEIGDVCVVLTYCQEETFSGAQVIYCTAENAIAQRLSYRSADDARP